MRLSRYYQQEQLTDQSASIFQPKPFVSPMETLGEGLSNSLERVVQQDQQAWIAEESARAQAKVFEIADGVERDIDSGDILDQKGLEEAFRTRVDGAFDEMQLQPKVRRQIQPDLTRLMSVNGLKLNRTLAVKRAKIEVTNLNDSLNSIATKAIGAQSPDELNEYLRIIRDTVSSVEGTFLDEEQKQKVLSGTLDFIHSSRANRLLLNPATDPATVKEYLTVHQSDLSPETFEKLNAVVESRIQTEREDGIFYNLLDGLEEAKNDGRINLDSIRTQIDENHRILGRDTVVRLQGMADSVERERRSTAANTILAQVERETFVNEDYGKAIQLLNGNRSLFDSDQFANALVTVERARKGEIEADQREQLKTAGDLVFNQVSRALAIDEDFDKANRILEENKGLLDQNTYEDIQLRIDETRKGKIDEAERDQQLSNIPSFQSQIGMGMYDSLNSQQMRQRIDTEIAVNRTLPRGSRMQLMTAFENRKLDLFNESQKISTDYRAISAGMKPANEKTAERLWKNQPQAQTDPEQFGRFIERYGSWKFQYDRVKDLIFNSNQAADFARGVEMGVQLWFNDPKQFKEQADEDTRKAIFWGYQEMRNVDDRDYEINPQTGQRIYSPNKNLQNANDKIKKRLFPEKEMLGITPDKIDSKAVADTADGVLRNVFYDPGFVKQFTGLATLNYAQKLIGSLFGSQTLGIRSQAEYSTMVNNIPAPPAEAREFFKNLVTGKVLDGMKDYKKAAELALPEFLDTYGITRIGVHQGTGYWQAAPAEWFIRKEFHSEESAEHAIKMFSDSIYQKAIELTKDNPKYATLQGRKYSTSATYGAAGLDLPPSIRLLHTFMGDKAEIEVPPPVRLVPKLNTLNQRMPDYYLGYEDEKTGAFIQLEENGEPVKIDGNKVIEQLRKDSNRDLFYETKGNLIPQSSPLGKMTINNQPFSLLPEDGWVQPSDEEIINRLPPAPDWAKELVK